MKKDFIIVDYSWDAAELLEHLGYANTQNSDSIYYSDKSLFKTAKHLFKNGLNVMIIHSPNNRDDILYVDTKKFGQR